MKTAVVAVFTGFLLVGALSGVMRAAEGGKLTENSVYQKNCAKCHGKTAEGRHFGGPSLVSDKTRTASSEELREIIGNGKGHMPKFADKLSAEDINRLVEEIRGMQTPGQ